MARIPQSCSVQQGKRTPQCEQCKFNLELRDQQAWGLLNTRLAQALCIGLAPRGSYLHLPNSGCSYFPLLTSLVPLAAGSVLRMRQPGKLRNECAEMRRQVDWQWRKLPAARKSQSAELIASPAWLHTGIEGHTEQESIRFHHPE